MTDQTASTLASELETLSPAVPPRLRAEIHDAHTVWFAVTGHESRRPLSIQDYRLSNSLGEPISIAQIVPRTADEALLIPEGSLDPTRVYFLEIPSQGLRAWCRFDGWFRWLYSNKTLGAEVNLQRTKTTFRIFAPRATCLRLYLYDSPMADAPASQTYVMQRDAMGVWEYVVDEDLHGVYYDFTVHGHSESGNYFYDTHPVHISDPYGRVSIDSFGRCRVWHQTKPATPLTAGRPKMEDIIAYEVHVQDFTDRLPVEPNLQGTFPAMVKPNLRNSHGQPIGFDHLVQLGINVVHLLPVQEFLHYPDHSWQAAFLDDPYMIEQGIHRENYQWGYRTTHAFAIESRYRTKGSAHGTERDEFRDLVQAFHDHQIAVIIDLVPNHTGENMDGRNYLFHFNALDKHYYYRTDESLNHIGPFGNEVKTEDRPMVQRWLIDQCKSLIDEFGIDGFRIDLAGQIDKQSLQRLRHELGGDIIIYGEPWIPPSDPDVASNPSWAWYKSDAPITFFQDEARDAFGSPPQDPTDKPSSRGFPGGNGSLRVKVMQGLLNSFPDEVDPNRGINYLDIHDNWALADRFATLGWDGRKGVDEDQLKIAVTLLFTSLGPIVLHGGTEILRSKGVASLEERTILYSDGALYFHGKKDTYNLRAANQFVWENIGVNKAEGAACNYAQMLDWWKGIIAFRRSEVGRVFRVGQAPPENYFQWILPDEVQGLGYQVDGKVLVLINTATTPLTFHFELPQATWRLIANNERVDHVHGVGDLASNLAGGAVSYSMPPRSLRIWHRS